MSILLLTCMHQQKYQVVKTSSKDLRHGSKIEATIPIIKLFVVILILHYQTLTEKVQNHDSSRHSLKDFIMSLNVHDTYREMNSQKQGYTYSNKSGSIQSRIDYIFLSTYLKSFVKKVYIQAPPHVPDHKAVVCSMRQDTIIGKGYWKFNAQLLKDKNFCEHIQQTIDSVKNDMTAHLNKRQLWDYCKVVIKEESIKWSKKSQRKLKTQKMT